MPILKDILALLETMAPMALAEAWDNPGLQIGSLNHDIGKVVVSLDPTLAAVQFAQEQRAELLITHHPLIFGTLPKLDTDRYPGNVLVKAAQDGLSIVAAHTNLDVAVGGINDILADALELQGVDVLRRVAGVDGVGLGRIGDLTSTLDLSEMIAKVKRVLRADDVAVIGTDRGDIRRVAVVGGSGGELIGEASERGADLLVTGEVGHHRALEAQTLGLSVIDAGHYRTERAAMRIFSERLAGVLGRQGWEMAVTFYTAETNPIRRA